MKKPVDIGKKLLVRMHRYTTFEIFIVNNILKRIALPELGVARGC
jgi:hypothetical protein